MKIRSDSGSNWQPTIVGTAEPTRTAPRRAAVCLLLVFATLAAFWPVLSAEFITYDDADYVTSNPHVRQGLSVDGLFWALGTGHAANWHPVTWWSHMLDVQIFGLDPAGPHAINLLLHVVNTLLLFLLLSEFTSAFWRSALVAALFALHPLHVESVAWIAERKDVLSTTFWLLTLWHYSRYARGAKNTPQPPSGDSPERALFGTRGPQYAMALLFFALGLMSKPMLVTVPFVLLLLDYWPLGRWEWSRAGWSQLVRGKLIREKIPFFVLSAISCCITFLAQKKGGTVQSTEAFSLAGRLGNVFISYVRYLGKMFWPTDLAVPYPHPGHWPLMWVLGAAALLAGVSVAALWLGRRWLFAFTGWFWFVGTLVPVIGLVQVGAQSMADRYAYVPSIGLFIGLIWGADRLRMRWGLPGWSAAAAVGPVLAACAFVTRAQSGYWKNTETLFRHTLAVTGENSISRDNLGIYLEQKGDLAGAMEQYRQAFVLNPNDNLAHDHMGLCYYKQGRIAEAMDHYRQALRIKPGDPEALNDLGSALVAQRRYAEAIESYEAALRSQPDYTEAHNNLGVVLNETGKGREAIEHYNKALRLRPDDFEVHSNLGNALVGQERYEEAMVQYQEAVRLNPRYTPALNNLGWLLSARGRHDEAAACYESALQINPNDATVRCNLGDALARAGRDDAAIPQYLEAVRLAPGNAEAHFGLGSALARNGRRTEAITHLKETLRLKPGYADAKQQLEALGVTE